MNKKQYNNIIENTLKHEQTEDPLTTARAIFDNMGVALPQGDMKTVYETIKTDNYMGWKSCSMQEAQEAADNGTAVIGISEDRIVVLSAKDEEQPVAQTAMVMTLDENTSAFAVDGLQYYSYSYGGTTTIGYGCGGQYRQVNTEKPNCFGYALFLDENPAVNSWWGSSHETEHFSGKFRVAIEEYYPCRRIDSFASPISSDEYRLAVRCPNMLDGVHRYHVIYQLSDGILELAYQREGSTFVLSDDHHCWKPDFDLDYGAEAVDIPYNAQILEIDRVR